VDQKYEYFIVFLNENERMSHLCQQDVVLLRKGRRRVTVLKIDVPKQKSPLENELVRHAGQADLSEQTPFVPGYHQTA
jgi:hypothetical protein